MMKLQGLGRQGKICAAASGVAVIEGNGEASWQGNCYTAFGLDSSHF